MPMGGHQASASCTEAGGTLNLEMFIGISPVAAAKMESLEGPEIKT